MKTSPKPRARRSAASYGGFRRFASLKAREKGGFGSVRLRESEGSQGIGASRRLLDRDGIEAKQGPLFPFRIALGQPFNGVLRYIRVYNNEIGGIQQKSPFLEPLGTHAIDRIGLWFKHAPLRLILSLASYRLQGRGYEWIRFSIDSSDCSSLGSLARQTSCLAAPNPTVPAEIPTSTRLWTSWTTTSTRAEPKPRRGSAKKRGGRKKRRRAELQALPRPIPELPQAPRRPSSRPIVPSGSPMARHSQR